MTIISFIKLHTGFRAVKVFYPSIPYFFLSFLQMKLSFYVL